MLRGLEGARMGAELPHVLLVLAARVQRVSWKYESMAYATVLKDAGAMSQTLYLACAAMGLRGCALGSGAPGAFAVAAGTQAHAESSVAEFFLGGPLQRGRYLRTCYPLTTDLPRASFDGRGAGAT